MGQGDDLEQAPVVLTPSGRAWLRLMRISNLPTVVSNVLVGAAVGAGDGEIDPLRVLFACLGVSIAYVGGMALNDIADIKTDRHERPERPIPAGQISLPQAIAFASLCLAAAPPLLWLAGVFSLDMGMLLIASIVLYNLLHKHCAWAVVFMGACRGFVYMIGVGANDQIAPLALPIALAVMITLYTIALTIIARMENATDLDRRKWLSIGMPIIVVAAGIIALRTHWLVLVVTMPLVAAWLVNAATRVWAHPPHTRQAVMMWIAGMSLVDAYLLASLGRPLPLLIAVACFAVTTRAHRRILGT